MSPVKHPAPKTRGPVPPPEPTGNSAHPVFAVHKTVPGFSVSDLMDGQKAAVLDAIYTRSRMTWTDIIVGGRNRMGTHTIKRRDIRPAIPDYLTVNDDILSFSFGQGVQRVIGYRSQAVFVIVWFDPDGRVYKH